MNHVAPAVKRLSPTGLPPGESNTAMLHVTVLSTNPAGMPGPSNARALLAPQLGEDTVMVYVKVPTKTTSIKETVAVPPAVAVAEALLEPLPALPGTKTVTSTPFATPFVAVAVTVSPALTGRGTVAAMLPLPLC